MFFRLYFYLLVATFFILGCISVGENLLLNHSRTTLDLLEIGLGIPGILLLFVIVALLLKNKFKAAVKIFSSYLCFYMLFFLGFFSYHYVVHVLGFVLSMFLLYISIENKKSKKIILYGVVFIYITIGALQTFYVIPEHSGEVTLDISDRIVLLVQLSLLVLGLAASMSNEKKTTRTVCEIEIIKHSHQRERFSDEGKLS